VRAGAACSSLTRDWSRRRALTTPTLASRGIFRVGEHPRCGISPAATFELAKTVPHIANDGDCDVLDLASDGDADGPERGETIV